MNYRSDNRFQPICKDLREDSLTHLFGATIKKKEEFSLHRAIDRIANEINDILENGYSREEVAAILSSGDFKIGQKTHKNST
jgi:thymidylate synthase